MGRGRQKAKQTKVARQLKYFSPDTDYSALQRELSTSSVHAEDDSHTDDVEDEEFDDESDDDSDESDDDSDDEYVGWSNGKGR